MYVLLQECNLKKQRLYSTFISIYNIKGLIEGYYSFTIYLHIITDIPLAII